MVVSSGDVSAQSVYPVTLTVEYPGRQSRWKVWLRLPLSLPALIFTLLLEAGALLPIWAAILVTGRIPGWLFDFQAAVNRWQARAVSYVVLITDQYPAFEGAYPVHYAVRDIQIASRWRLVVWKLLTAVPHLIVLFVLWVTLIPVTLIAWIAIVLSGRHPPMLHGYAVGVVRWSARLEAYLQSLTDEFPPFALTEDAGVGSNRAYVASSVGGIAVVAGLVGLFVTAVLTFGQHVERQVSYRDLVTGNIDAESTRAEVISGVARLTAANDPADDMYLFLEPKDLHRLIDFTLTMTNQRDENPSDDVRFSNGAFSVAYSSDRLKPVLVIVNGRVAPYSIDPGEVAIVTLVFEAPGDEVPEELRYDVLNYIDGPRIGETIVWKFR